MRDYLPSARQQSQSHPCCCNRLP